MIYLKIAKVAINTPRMATATATTFVILAVMELTLFSISVRNFFVIRTQLFATRKKSIDGGFILEKDCFVLGFRFLSLGL